jgi:hypothetical protein
MGTIALSECSLFYLDIFTKILAWRNWAKDSGIVLDDLLAGL